MGEALVSSEISLAVSTGIFTLQFSSVAQSCLTLCNPTNRSLPGLPVHHQLPEFTQLTSIESVMPSSHLILCHPILLLPPIPPSIKVFSNESVLRMRWSFSFRITPSKEHRGLISFRMDGLFGSPCGPRDSQESYPTAQFKSINSLALSFLHRVASIITQGARVPIPLFKSVYLFGCTGS